MHPNEGLCDEVRRRAWREIRQHICPIGKSPFSGEPANVTHSNAQRTPCHRDLACSQLTTARPSTLQMETKPFFSSPSLTSLSLSSPVPLSQLLTMSSFLHTTGWSPGLGTRRGAGRGREGTELLCVLGYFKLQNRGLLSGRENRAENPAWEHMTDTGRQAQASPKGPAVPWRDSSHPATRPRCDSVSPLGPLPRPSL